MGLVVEKFFLRIQHFCSVTPANDLAKQFGQILGNSVSDIILRRLRFPSFFLLKINLAH